MFFGPFYDWLASSGLWTLFSQKIRGKRQKFALDNYMISYPPYDWKS